MICDEQIPLLLLNWALVSVTFCNMYIFKACPLLLFIGLSTSSTLAANQSLALVINTTSANADDYIIPTTSPPVSLAVSRLSPHQEVPIDAPSVYMCAIENLARLCRHNPRGEDFANRKLFSYGTATIRMERLEPRRQPYFSHNVACAVLRGLPEFMTLNDWWVESFVRVFVGGTMVGTAQVWNPNGEGRNASVNIVGAQVTAEAVATA